MKAWIMSVGDEVLSGRVVNTNSSYLATKLEEIGITTKEMVVCGDDSSQIDYHIQNFLKSDCEVLISSGGLGPTHDDITVKAISDSLGLELVYYKEAEDNIKRYFKNYNYNSCNLKQAYFPKGSIIIPNNLGTAPGAILEVDGKIIIILVGPPFELKPMFEEHCIPHLNKYNPNKLLVNNYTVMGVGESEIEPTIMEIATRNPKVSINPYFSIGKIRFQLSTEEKNLLEFNTAKKDFEVTLGEYIISSENENIEEVLVKRLKELKYTISFCESCTGGLLASTIIDVSGASSVINESLVTYSNESKIKYLNVSNQTIEKYDVASLEVAKEMSEGLFELTKSNVCVSVTGVAGPTSPNPEIPVGSVFFGVSINGETTLFSNVFKGNRSLVRQKAVKWILYKTYLLLKERG